MNENGKQKIIINNINLKKKEYPKDFYQEQYINKWKNINKISFNKIQSVLYFIYNRLRNTIL